MHRHAPTGVPLRSTFIAVASSSESDPYCLCERAGRHRYHEGEDSRETVPCALFEQGRGTCPSSGHPPCRHPRCMDDCDDADDDGNERTTVDNEPNQYVLFDRTCNPCVRLHSCTRSPRSFPDASVNASDSSTAFLTMVLTLTLCSNVALVS